MEDKYYVCRGKKGISHFDLSNDTMSAIIASDDKSKWIQFSLKEANEVARHCNYIIVKVT